MAANASHPPPTSAGSVAAVVDPAAMDAGKDASYFGAALDIGPWPQVCVVIVERSVDAAKAAVAEIYAEAEDASSSAPFVLGVDMEWVALKRTGKAKEIELRRCPVSDFWTEKVSLVQIATAKKVYLFRLCSYPSPNLEAAEAGGDFDFGAIPAPLAEVLTNADRRFVFAGVGIDGDRTRVARDFGGLSIAPCLDIVKAVRHLAATTSSRFDVASHPKAAAFVAAGTTEQKTCNSLADYASKVFDFALPKDLAVTCSNWTQRRLDTAQIFYAAADAFASHQLAVTMLDVFAVKPANLLELCATSTPLKEVKPKAAKGPSQPNANSNANDRGKKPTGTYSGRKQPYYGNIKVLEAKADGSDDNGAGEEPRVLFTVSTAKADWYIKEELATVVNPGVNNDDGTYTGRVIQLKFRPNLDRGDEDRALRPDASFFAADKENCCVVCADDDPPGGVVRFFVVPQAYRKFFPREFVNHNSFDIVLVCVSCMKKVNVLYEAERKALEDSFKYPISWHSVKTINEMKRAESDEAGGDADSASPPPPPSTGLAVAEHNRTILNMGKSATALVMAFAAGESVSAASRAKNKVVSLPPDRFAMLVNSIDEHMPTYIFPDAAAAIEAHGTTHYKGKPHWHDKYWQLLKDKHDGTEATTSAPIVLPTTGDVCTNKTSWRDVYNVMRAERWKVKLRNSAIQNPDRAAAAAADDDGNEDGGNAAAADDAASSSGGGGSVGASHFEFVVNEIMRTAVVGGATVGAPFTQSAARQPSPDESEWVAQRAAANGGTLGAGKPEKPKSGKPGQGADTPRVVLEAVCRFIFRWRSMFQTGLQPKRMPQGWYPRQGLIGLPAEAAADASTVA